VKLGVCVLNWNAGDALTKCLEQLRIACKDYVVELIVVDNDSSDGSVDSLQARVGEVSVLRNSRNLGYARGNNVGAQYLCSKLCTHLLFINPDVLISATSIGSLVESLSHDAGAGAAGGLPRNAQGISRMAARSRPTPLEKLVSYGPLHRIPLVSHLSRRHFLDLENIEDGQRVYAICGACILFRTEAFQAAGGFDESTFLYEEELIMSERLQASRYFFVLSKRCTYFHTEAGSTRRMPYRRRLHFIQSEQHLLKAYYGWHFGMRLLFRACRYAEWAFYAASWKLRPKLPANESGLEQNHLPAVPRRAEAEELH
jgi:N-acetylglucosaminyl-diphospho-decaprenol L-rhamnosyltransferase